MNSLLQPNEHEEKKPDPDPAAAGEDGAGKENDYTNVADLQKSLHALPPAAPPEGTEPCKVLDDEWAGYVPVYVSVCV